MESLNSTFPHHRCHFRKNLGVGGSAHEGRKTGGRRKKSHEKEGKEGRERKNVERKLFSVITQNDLTLVVQIVI